MQNSLNRQKLKHQGVSTPLVLNIYEKIEKLRIKKRKRDNPLKILYPETQKKITEETKTICPLQNKIWK